MTKRLWITAAVFSSLLALTFFVYLCWLAGTDAQGAIGLVFYIPVLIVLGAIGIKYALKSSRVLLVFVTFILLPVIIFYFFFLGAIIYKPLGSVPKWFLSFVSEKFELTTGVSSWDWGRGTRLIHIAAREGNVRLVEDLIKNGVPVDFVNGVNETPLFFCVYGNSIQMCKLLLKLGADIDHKRNDDKTALDLAKMTRKHDLFNFLKTWK